MSAPDNEIQVQTTVDYRFCRHIVVMCRQFFGKRGSNDENEEIEKEFENKYPAADALKKGSMLTRLSVLVFGTGCLAGGRL